MARKKSYSGYSLIELALTIAILVILSTFAYVSFGDTQEARDARLVQSTQAVLQTVVTQGTARLSLTPTQLRNTQLPAVLVAARSYIGQDGNTSSNGVQLASNGNTIVVSIDDSSRQATYSIEDNGNINLLTVTNFNHYEAQNGIISKK
ncbi:MAG: prepilin-type N-terminal cleavage/methylation domain-containing protein [Cyanobacteria bacterium P01_H01_bin.74]